MLFYSNKYLCGFLQKKITGIVLLLMFSTIAHAQNKLLQKDTLVPGSFNPLFIASYKKPAGFMILDTKTPVYPKYNLRTGGELMHWPNYPLTTAQIIARQEDWQRRNSQSIGRQIAGDVAHDIIRNQVNALIYGRKMPVAAIPRF